jgi:hypothetical protein
MFLRLPEPENKSEVQIRILPFSHKGVEGNVIMLEIENFNTKFYPKIKFI